MSISTSKWTNWEKPLLILLAVVLLAVAPPASQVAHLALPVFLVVLHLQIHLVVLQVHSVVVHQVQRVVPVQVKLSSSA